MHPDRVMLHMDRRSYGLSTRPYDPNTLTVTPLVTRYLISFIAHTFDMFPKFCDKLYVWAENLEGRFCAMLNTIKNNIKISIISEKTSGSVELPRKLGIEYLTFCCT